MGVAILTRGQQIIWWEAAEKRILGATKPKSGIWGRIKQSAYDMGQNIAFLIRKLTGYKATFLQIPGHENCSSFVSSIVSCGFEALEAYGPNWLHLQMNVNETSQVAPSHFGMVPESYRRLAPGEKIRDGCVILSLSWDAIDFGLTELLDRLIHLNPRQYQALGEIFKDGIRVTQRDVLGHDDPYWRATHAMFKWFGDEEMQVVSQEELAKIKIMSQSTVWAEMAGAQPRYVVLEPRFLYG